MDIPQINLYEYQSQNELMRFSLGLKIRHDFTDRLPLIFNRRVKYSYAEDDDDASFGVSGKQI
jgi:hypothetical protein